VSQWFSYYTELEFSYSPFVKEEFSTFAVNSDELNELEFLISLEDEKPFYPNVLVVRNNKLFLSQRETCSSIYSEIPLREKEKKFSLFDLILMPPTVPTPEPTTEPPFSAKDLQAGFYLFSTCKICRDKKCKKILKELHKEDINEVKKQRLKNVEINKTSSLYKFAEFLTKELKKMFNNDKITTNKVYTALKRIARIDECGKTGHIVVEYLAKNGDFNLKNVKYLPHRCHSHLCPICEWEKSRERLSKVSGVFEKIVSEGAEVAFWTITAPATYNPFEGTQLFKNALHTLRTYKVYSKTLFNFDELFKVGLAKYEQNLREKLEKGEISKKEFNKKIYIQKKLYEKFRKRLEDLLEVAKLKGKKYIRFYEIGKFVIKIEVNVKESGYNFHAHMLTDIVIPKVFLSEFANSVLGLGYIADVRAVKGEKAIKEIAKYVTKTSEFGNLCVFSQIIFETAMQGVKKLRIWNIQPDELEEEEKERTIKISLTSSAVQVEKSDFREEFRKSFYQKSVEFLTNIYKYEVSDPQRKAKHYAPYVENRKQIAKYYIFDKEYFAIVDYESLLDMERTQLIRNLAAIMFSFMRKEDWIIEEKLEFRRRLEEKIKQNSFFKGIRDIISFIDRLSFIYHEILKETKSKKDTLEIFYENLEEKVYEYPAKIVRRLLIYSQLLIYEIMRFNYWSEKRDKLEYLETKFNENESKFEDLEDIEFDFDF
jgi:hypothetical protein